MADEELSPDKADANRHLTLTRQKALEGWFLKRESLRKAITGQAPLTFELYGGEEKVRMQILATDESIYYTLSKLTDDSQLKELYVYTAALLVLQLRLSGSELSAPVEGLGHGLVRPSPERPSHDKVGSWRPGAEPRDQAAELRHAEGDEELMGGSPPPFTAFSLARSPARRASASMASVTCRCQPRQLRTS